MPRSWKTWKPDAPAEAWLHRIAINVAYSYVRQRRLREVGELVRMDISILARVGAYRALKPRMPVVQWRVVKP